MKIIYDEDDVKVEGERVGRADTSITKIMRFKQSDNIFPEYIMQVSGNVFLSEEGKTKDIETSNTLQAK